MADLIKKIKIKKQDGTFTDYIPIGADAANVETSDGESVQLKLNKKPYYYTNVASMKADIKLKAGDVVQTLGYYEANDGGSGLYKIVDDSQLVDDGGSIHDLANGLKAELTVITNEVNVKQFGAKGDEIHDDTDSWQNAINYTKNKKLKLKGLKNYSLISRTLIFPSNLTVETIHLIPSINGTFTNDFMIFINTINGTSWTEGWNSIVNTRFNDIALRNNDSSFILNGIRSIANIQISNIYAKHINKVFDSSGSTYIDMIKINNVQISGKTGNDYAIETSYLGDACEIDEVHIYETVGTNNCIKMGSARKPSKIKNVINGKIYCGGGVISISNYHGEGTGSTIELVNGNYSLDTLTMTGSKPSIKLTKSHANINNFVSVYNLSTNNTSDIDIELTNSSSCELHECYKNLFASDGSAGLLCRSAINTNINDLVFNNNSNISNDSYKFENKIVRNITGRYLCSGISNVSYGTWKIANSIFYYNGHPFYDKERLIGTDYTDRRSIDKTNDSKCVQFTGVPVGVPIRLMRGTSQSNLTHYVDIISYDGVIIDDGIICNGKMWQQYDTPQTGAEGNYFKEKIEFNGQNCITYRTSLHTLGTWKKGDIVYNPNIASGQIKGWICTEDGTPGTWISLGDY